MTPANIIDRARMTVARSMGVDEARITAETNFTDDLGDSLAHVELLFDVEAEFDLEIPDDEAAKLATFGLLTTWLEKALAPKSALPKDRTDAADELLFQDRCIACDVPMKAGDRYYPDVSGGNLHAACCGPERECYVDLDSGEPIGPDEPIPDPSIWEDDPRAVAA